MLDSSPSEMLGLNSYFAPNANVRLGVTGHRTLENPAMICEKIEEVLADLEQWFEGRNYTVEILTSLADGTDRLVPQCVLAKARKDQDSASGAKPDGPEVDLKIVLPIREDVYCKTFLDLAGSDSTERPSTANSPSVKEFHALLAGAKTILTAPMPTDSLGNDPAEVYKNAADRHAAYRWTGNYIVEHCDILLAVSNGKRESRPGSTAQVVEYARRSGRSVVWIHAQTGEIKWLVSGDDLAAQYFFFRQYDEELHKVKVDSTAIDQRYLQLVREAERAGLANDGFSQLRSMVLPRFLQARDLATQYQKYYYFCGSLGYLCAALAVCTAAVLSLAYPKGPRTWYLLEALFIVVTTICGQLLKHRGWQRKWIDYRYLAERLRATCFLYIAGIPFEPAPAYPDTQFDWLPDGWVSLALRKVWSGLPVLKSDEERFRDSSQVRALGAFLFRAWINNQQLYYFEASDQNKTRNERYEGLALVLLALTGLIALIYGAAGLFRAKPEDWLSMLDWLEEGPHIAAVAFPAITSALAGIMIFRHFARNAERYSSMSHFLGEVGVRLLTTIGLSGNEEQIPDLATLRRLVQDADRAMAHEHEGWRTVFGVRLPGPG
jgi:hypothetical protein